MTRLGKSLITDTELLSFERIIAEIEAVQPDEVAELAGLLFSPERLSISGIGPSERVVRAAVRRINPTALAPLRDVREKMLRTFGGLEASTIAALGR